MKWKTSFIKNELFTNSYKIYGAYNIKYKYGINMGYIKIWNFSAGYNTGNIVFNSNNFKVPPTNYIRHLPRKRRPVKSSINPK